MKTLASWCVLLQIGFMMCNQCNFYNWRKQGNVTLWDVNTQNPYRNFENTHKAPASEICFSPVNELLLVTVGLDKRINLYDTSSKKWVRWRPLIFVGCERFMSWKSTSSYDIICLIQSVFRVVEVADTLLLENLFQNPFCFFSFN